MPTLDPKRNDAVVQFGAGFAAGATTASLISGDGAKLPDTAEGAFNLTVWDNTLYPNAPYLDPNRERIRVTVRTGDVLTTIQRAQEGTSNVNHNTSGHIYKAVLSYTKKDRDDLETFLGTVARVGVTNTFTVDQIFESKVAVGLPAALVNLHVRGIPVWGRGNVEIDDSTAQAVGTGGALSLGGKWTDVGAYTTGAIISAEKENAISGNYGFGMALSTLKNGDANFTERMRINSIGNVSIATADPVISDGVGLHLAGKILRLGTAKTPTGSGDTINTGEIFWDANYLYVGVGTNSIKRIALTTF